MTASRLTSLAVFLLAVGLSGTRTAPGADLSMAAETVLWRRPFDDGAAWTNLHRYGALRIDRTADALTVTGLNAKKENTDWQVATTVQRLAVRGRYALCCSFESKGTLAVILGSACSLDTSVIWYDGAGRQLARHPLGFVFADGPAYDYRFVESVPDGAEAFQIKLGWDMPNLWDGKYVRFSNLRLVQAAANEPVGSTRPDVIPPRIRIVSATPTDDRTAPVVLSVTDPSGVDAASLAVTVDGKARTDFARTAAPNGFRLSIAPSAAGWTNGLHTVLVTAADACGRTNDAKKVFLIGGVPATPPVTLRADGMTLVGGEPFFPIGVFDVCKREFNAYDWNRAMSDLKAGGFNFVHSYTKARDPGFLAAAAKCGMKIWMAAYHPDNGIVSRYRHNPNVLAWYLGDDTSVNTTIQKLDDRSDNIRAVDPTRLTTQAEELQPYNTPDAYWHYVPATDNFMPEIYPVRGKSETVNRRCVAVVAREMDLIAEDQRRNGGGRPRSCWPIIQNFRGGGWNRCPTGAEFYGMCFAAVIHGAQGLTVYSYGGPNDRAVNHGIDGIASAEAVWRSTTNATRRLAALAPVLTARSPAQPPVPTVLSGPARDALGGASVTALKKVKDGRTFLFAVNAADAAVKAKLAIGVPGKVCVLWEKRTREADSAGAFTDTFKPLEVHVYAVAGLSAE